MTVATGVRLGPYEVLASVGAGGMGEVYRARDTRLGRDVAIKVLPGEFAADPERLRRFEQEARAAAALSHPNILVLYDVGSAVVSEEDVGEGLAPSRAGTSPAPTKEGQPSRGQRTIHYLVTELLEGESLREQIGKGGLTISRSIDLGMQIARGLAAAHERGIVHRDLKPGNVFVTSDGTVKLLDFGLAKLLEAEGPVEVLRDASTRDPQTATGARLGTVGYMAPEQVRGLAVDHRADIFAFGCVLYEMLSGRRAFKGDTEADTISAILTKDPPPLSGPDQGPPVVLQGIVSRCLEKRREDRFSSAHDLALALGTTSQAAPLPAASRPRSWPGRRWLLASVTALVLIGAAVSVSLLRDEQQGSPLDPKRVVVAIFENQSGDSSLDALGRLAADSISEGLSRTGIVDVVPSSTVFSLAEQHASGEKVGFDDPVGRLADATGSGLVVSGSYYAEGAQVHVHATVTDASAPDSTSLEPAVAERSTPEKAVDEVRRRVMGAIAVRFDTTFQVGTTGAAPDYRAYQEYLAGTELAFVDDRAAMSRWNSALEIDPTFVAARLALIGRSVHLALPDADGHLAILEKQRERLTPAQRHWLVAYRARRTGRHEEALAAAREAARLTPDDAASLNALAVFAANAYHLRESVDLATSPILRERLGGSAARSARRWLYYWNLCVTLHHLGEDERALAEARRGRELDPDATALIWIQTRPLAGLGRVDEVDRVLAEYGQTPSGGPYTYGEVLLGAASELRWHGHREAGVKVAKRAIDWLRDRPAEEAEQTRTRGALAWAYCLAERWAEARPVLADLVRDVPGDEDFVGWLGIVAARSGNREEAMRISDELARFGPPGRPGRATYQRAAVSAHLGEKERAVRLLRQAVAEGYQLEMTHGNFEMAPLIGYPPFEELMQPKG